ncbi:MAG: mannose-1-phosphate guanylyltransferase [Legionellales bacterium]|nr:mannose-1-phosphate guanylyltransferase [Legionellales bacterium]|tara:strand:+ start:394 stop:1062 length:669 start_codon:yes stop_codon:yes gene_type:complete
MKAIILAAGEGRRLKPLTDHIPKPLLKINGQCLIEYHINALVKAGINEIIINVSHLGQQIIDTLGDGHRYNAKLAYSIESEPLETAGGILKALPLLGSNPFIAISADIFTDYHFKNLVDLPIHLAHLVLTDNPPFHPNGDFALEKSIVKNDGKPLYNFAGISVLSPLLFKDCKSGKFSLAPLLRSAINNFAVSGEYFQGIWHNIGTMEIYQTVQQKFANNKV